jgi:CheY-like chemotaxis protein
MAASTVLIATPDPILAALLRLLLEDAGHRVLRENVPLVHLRCALTRHVPDCIVLDGEPLTVSESAWVEVARLHNQHPAIPVILFTAAQTVAHEARARLSARARAAAFASVILAPFAANDLLDTVAQQTVTAHA